MKKAKGAKRAGHAGNVPVVVANPSRWLERERAVPWRRLTIGVNARVRRVVDASHGGGPVARRCTAAERTGAKADRKRSLPVTQRGQRAISTRATRAMKAATDSTIAGCGAGTSSKARQMASFAALCRLASRP